MLSITCLLWGDDPSQGFLVNISPKDTIFSLKQKIIEQLDLGNNITRRIQLIKIKEFVTLDDERLKQIDNEPKDLFNSENLDKPFQILDEYFTAKDDNLKEFPLDIIVLINNAFIPSTLLDKKENEPVIMAPHKPIPTIIKESAVVSNNNKQALLSKKDILIDPSLFPSIPSDYNKKFKEKENSQTNLNNIDIDTDIFPRTKSIIFNIDRFPSPPSDNEEINNGNNNDNNYHDNNTVEKKGKDKFIVYDIDQFPDAPLNEDFSITSKLPLTYSEESPPSYDAISNKSQKIIPNNINNSGGDSNNNNAYIGSNSNMNNNQIEFMKKDKKSKNLRRQILITSSLCLGIIISTLLAIFISKSLLSYKGGNPGNPVPPKSTNSKVISIGKVVATTKRENGVVTATSTIEFSTKTIYNYPTYKIEKTEIKTIDDRKELTVKITEPYLSEVRWNMKVNNTDFPSMRLKIVDLDNKTDKNGSLKKYFTNNKNIVNNLYNTEMSINSDTYTNTNTNTNTNINTNSNTNANTKINNNYNAEIIKPDSSMIYHNNYINYNNYNYNNNNNNNNNQYDQHNTDYSNNYDQYNNNNNNNNNNNGNNNYDQYNTEFSNNYDQYNNNNNNGDNNNYDHSLIKKDNIINNEVPMGFGEDKGPINEFHLDKKDFSLEMELILKRIVEVNSFIKRENSTNFIEFDPKYDIEEDSAVFDTSDNLNGGDICVKREFRKNDNNSRKEVSIIGKFFTGKGLGEENKMNLQDPTVSRFLISIKRWEPIYKDSMLQLEVDVVSNADLYWSNVYKKSIYFGEGQGILRFSEKYSDLMLGIEYDKDIYSDQKSSTFAFNIYGNSMTPLVDNFSRNTPKNDKQGDRMVVLTLEADMSKFTVLKEITSSGISYKKFHHTYLLFVTIIIMLYYIIV